MAEQFPPLFTEVPPDLDADWVTVPVDSPASRAASQQQTLRSSPPHILIRNPDNLLSIFTHAAEPDCTLTDHWTIGAPVQMQLQPEVSPLIYWGCFSSPPQKNTQLHCYSFTTMNTCSQYHTHHTGIHVLLRTVPTKRTFLLVGWIKAWRCVSEKFLKIYIFSMNQ